VKFGVEETAKVEIWYFCSAGKKWRLKMHSSTGVISDIDKLTVAV